MPDDSEFAFSRPVTDSSDVQQASDLATAAGKAISAYKPNKDFGVDDRSGVRPFGSNPHGSIDAQGKVHGM